MGLVLELTLVYYRIFLGEFNAFQGTHTYNSSVIFCSIQKQIIADKVNEVLERVYTCSLMHKI